MGFLHPGQGFKRRFNHLSPWLVESPELAVPYEKRKVPKKCLSKDHGSILERFPLDILLEIVCQAGILHNSLNLANRHFAQVLLLSLRINGDLHDGWFLEELIRGDFVHDLNCSVKDGWQDKFDRKIQALGLEADPKLAALQRLPSLLHYLRHAIDMRLFNLKFVSSSRVVEIIHGMFPQCMLLTMEDIADEQQCRQRHMEWQYKKLGVMVSLRQSQPDSFPSAEALEEAAMKNEDLSDGSEHIPRLRSGLIPEDWLDRLLFERFEKVVALHRLYDCRLKDFGKFLTSSFDHLQALDDQSQNVVFDMAPPQPSLDTITMYLHLLAKARYVQTLYPLETRHSHPSTQLVNKLFHLVAAGFNTHTFANDDKEALLWHLLSEIDMHELVVVAMNNGATPNLSQFSL